MTVTWTDEEQEFLRENYSLMAMEDLATHLNRTLQAIYGQAKRLGINRKKKKQPARTFLVTVALPREHFAWIARETPRGATVSDTARAIITDAYCDEMAAQPRSEAPEARKAFPPYETAASMKRPCAGENMGAI